MLLLTLHLPPLALVYFWGAIVVMLLFLVPFLIYFYKFKTLFLTVGIIVVGLAAVSGYSAENYAQLFGKQYTLLADINTLSQRKNQLVTKNKHQRYTEKINSIAEEINDNIVQLNNVNQRLASAKNSIL